MYLFLSVVIDLFRDLDNGSGQGLISYDISMSTLNEVFMEVEGKSTIEQGKIHLYNLYKINFQITMYQFSIYNILHMIHTKEYE